MVTENMYRMGRENNGETWLLDSMHRFSSCQKQAYSSKSGVQKASMKPLNALFQWLTSMKPTDAQLPMQYKVKTLKQPISRAMRTFSVPQLANHAKIKMKKLHITGL